MVSNRHNILVRVTYDVCRTPEKHGGNTTAAEASVEEWQVGDGLFGTDVAVIQIVNKQAKTQSIQDTYAREPWCE